MGHGRWPAWVLSPGGQSIWTVCVSMCLPSYTQLEYLPLEFNFFTWNFLIPTLSFCEFMWALFLSRPTLPSHRSEYITIYLHFLLLSPHLSFILCLMSLPVPGSCSAGQKQNTFLYCECVFLYACLFLRVTLCVVGWQQVTVSNGPDLKVDIQLLSLCLCAGVG